jgi:hypothetical protein
VHACAHTHSAGDSTSFGFPSASRPYTPTSAYEMYNSTPRDWKSYSEQYRKN